jgi:uncharacterized protein
MLVRLVAGAAICVGIASAADFAALRPEGHVSDFARVLDPASKTRLEQYCRSVERQTGAEIALVTIPTLDGEPIEDVANVLFRKWGVGKKSDTPQGARDQGILLLLAIQDRRSRLEVGYGLEAIIPDGMAGSLLREMRPALSERRYGDALSMAADSIGSRIAQASGVTLDQTPPQRSERAPAVEPAVPIASILGILLFMGVLAGLRRRGYHGGSGFLLGVILGNLLSRSTYTGRGGGGFGGYDSGDTFGGFGGGDSGGGGASSSW